MLGYSQTIYEVFVFTKKACRRIEPKVEVETKLLPLGAVTREHWRQVGQLQGRLAVSYLKFRYGSANTYVLLAYFGEELVHAEWIVPAEKIKGRYPFVADGSYSIISCLTLQSFRGLGIYPSQIQKVVKSNIQAETFWIWTASTNAQSLKGIGKAGGIKVGEFVQKKWLWGCISHIEYFPERSSNR